VPAEGGPLLAASRVAVRFARAARDAVGEVSLALRAGERLALLGPSGSGKTTLALALLGAIPNLVPATRRGMVAWAGLPDGALAAGTGVAAAVLQDSDAQLVALTVEDELAFALENRGLDPDAIEARIARALARAPGQGLARRDRTLALSGGWRQRLALAAALAEAPRALVIDEPVAHLDGEAARDAVAAVAAACTDGAAALLVEHRIDHVRALAPRALVLDAAGRPQAEGATESVLRDLAARDAAPALRLPPDIRVAAALARARRAAAPGAVDPLAVALDTLGFARAPRAAAGAPLLEIDGACVRRGGRELLTDISLVAHAGEVVGVVGPNGAGKTTLGLLAAGGLAASRGLVRRRGAAPVHVPQNPALAFATGRLDAEAARHGLGWSDAAAVIARAGLDPDPGRHPLAFSQGERRRLALAFALARPRQRLAVLDEPAAGLDGTGLAALGEDIAALRRAGIAVLVVAHDLDWLAAVADRIVVLDAGRMRADAPPALVLRDALAGRLPLAPPPGAALAASLGWRFDVVP
jgi:energy-coupling factor transporter ATP-binding protein EcfA2